MSLLGTLYARGARARRRSWEHPGRQRRLQRPVISVGNLRVGGTGKTPVAACVARHLLALGERPAVLSRGYGRRRSSHEPVVVSDGTFIRADVDRAGDEPLMLARLVPAARVVVCADRYRAGRVAELHLDASAHVLDDGFQHLRLARDADLLIVTVDDERTGRTLPGGRLRESIDAAASADALLVPDVDIAAASAMADRLRVTCAFAVRHRVGRGRRLDALQPSAPFDAPAPVFAVAGIARPDRFFDVAVRAGYTLVGRTTFRDHYRFDAADVAAIAAAAVRAGAAAILTTEKDLVRLLAFRPFALPLAWLPLETDIEPADAFRAWLAGRLAARADAGEGRRA